LRNARRAIFGIPPLIDRLSGLNSQIEDKLRGKHYDLGVIEHFWCAPYVDLLSRYCGRVVLDLHNVESVLHERCANFSHGAVKAGHRRFAGASRRLEAALLPKFAAILATSEDDARTIRAIAPAANVQVYPNSFPLIPQPSLTEEPVIVFSANFEYHPNIDAVEFLAKEIWPEIARRHPALRLRLVGRGDSFIRKFLAPGPESRIETTGPIPDALAEIAKATMVIAPLRVGSGTRLKIIEAWAAGKAVVATPLAAEGLAARDGENIRLAGTAAEIVNAVDALLQEPQTRFRLGAAGRTLYENAYSWNAAWQTLDLNAQLTRNFGLNSYTEKT
jgi:glycosyltransferase involved in cell wall biosynthesis